MKVSYFRELDGVRAFAALMVMFFHFFQTADDGSAVVNFLSKIAVFGQTGVSLFFVLSGFLITRILIATRDSKNFFSAFYLRRILRIFPLYYLYLILYYFVLPFVTQSDFADWGQQFWYWFYLQGFPMTFNWPHAGPDHFWSLAVEEHFYLFWPILLFYIHPSHISRIIAVIIAIAICLRLFFVYQSYETFYFTFTRMDELAMGALIAVLELKNKLSTSYFNRYLASFLLLALPLIGLWVWTSGSGILVIQVVKYNFISISFFCILCIILSSKSDSFLNRFLRNRVLFFLGKVSYGLYVYHPFVYLLYATYTPISNVFLNFAGSFLLTVVIATMSYYSFETPFLKMKKYFTYSVSKRSMRSELIR
ncbi:peptidoglycan/LPS O-acetylase OafA/YrhL [Algoriphagus boseongensis]|uniref:Peptidoglycan/LPS O-acetylase OafA/YrhL n=1 Tax=Algoriphagus boseongensis TaxID=1442587 RepID=A0A4R6TCD1_9BACT|nr:acyltransferase [Algoriphagus boseongensis]TDQ19365.1 peptidoglycan/LPS O-acetylase OafA/YrhL [Algoriphagus boseongensis]